MEKLTEFFIKRRVLFWSLVWAIIFAGVFCFTLMPKLEDPVVTVKQAMVVVPYPGASAHEVELKAVQPLEDAFRTMPDVKKVKSECHDASAMITVEFEMSVPVEDMEQRFDLLRRKVSDISSSLPQDCYTPVVVDDMMDVYGIVYALTGDGYDYPDLYRQAKYLRQCLLDVPGVKRVSLAGNRDEVINVIVSKDKIARNGLIPTQIAMTLQNAGKVVAAGSSDGVDGARLPFRVGDGIRDEEDVRELAISTFDGKAMRIGDVATVERGYSEPQRNGFFMDGKPAIAISVAIEASAIVPDVGKDVDAMMQDALHDIPVGMQVDKVYFQPEKVSKAIGSFMLNLIESVLIVIVMLIFTMGFRSGVIIGFGLFLTICLSFPILFFTGTTLQRISLGAFIVAMGMLVDNAIVIMDGILVDKAKGLGPKTYLYRIGRQTAMPLLGATIIAAATFMGIYLMPGTVSEYARDLFMVICVSLLASWVIALVQVPMCAKSWMSPRIKEPKTPREIAKARRQHANDTMDTALHRFVRRMISSLVDHKKLTVAVAFCLLALSAWGLMQARNIFFPDFDSNQFVVECFFPSQTGPDTVRDNLLKMTAELKENPEVRKISASMGAAPSHYCLVRPMTNGGDCYGELIIDCDDYAAIVRQIPVIRRQLREEWPDAYIRIKKYNFSVSTSHTVEVEFQGPDVEVLRDLSAQAEAIMRQSPYADSYSVGNNWHPRSKAIVAEYDGIKATGSGIGRADVGNALQAATDGMTIGVLSDQDRNVLVNLQVRNVDGSRISDIEDIPVWSTMNVHFDQSDIQGLMAGSKGVGDIQDKLFKSTVLSNVTDGVRLAWDDDMVLRVNGRRAIEAECDPNPDDKAATSAKLLSDIRPQIDAIPLPDGYTRVWRGEQELQTEAMGGLFKYMAVSIVIVLVVLLLLFNSWKKLLLILLCFPFVLCGIAPTLLLTGTPLTFMALIGIMGLIGMIVKNAIVLVDEIDLRQRVMHESPYKAVIDGAVSRVRPVCMASLTTIAGVIPLLGDPMYGSLAATIMGGLAVGTVVTLILLPLFYTAFFHVRKEAE